MPLVFVHGVNVRHGELYDREMAFRNRHFAEILYKQLGRTIESNSIFNPYWGDLGASLSADAPFLPRGHYEMLWRKQMQNNPELVSDIDHDEYIEDLFDPDSETPLIDMARTASLADVIDLLWTLVDEDMLASGNECNDTAQEIARLAQRALDFSHSPEGELWLENVKSDEEILAKLGSLLNSSSIKPRQATASNVKSSTSASNVESNTSATESNSKARQSEQSAELNKDDESKAKRQITDLLQSAGKRLSERIANMRQNLAAQSESLKGRIKEDVLSARLRLRERAVSTTARIFNEPVRAIFHKQCALLIGDAFAYFSTRGDDNKASPIAQRVIESLREAQAVKEKTGEELIVIGHSMGGVILCDIVSCYGKDVPIDVLITVGSQFPLFADLQMFPGINGIPRPIPKPENVKKWINIFDPHDFLGYPASHTFSGVNDFHLPTYALGASSHTNYFNRRSFYFQLARRLADYLK